MKNMLTILTPTYNRGEILCKAYESLRSQTCHEFEWIVVDDGSQDDTERIVEQWKTQDNGFSIVYVKQENGGKHRAVNRGVELAKAEYVLILDSDDYLTDDAVACVHKWILDIAGLPSYAGVAGLKGWQHTDTAVGGIPKYEYVDATNIQRRKYGLLGDKAEVYKTELLRKYPFPEFPGENFLRESAVWDAIALDGYRLRWYSHLIYKCEYLEGGLTRSNDIIRGAENFQGHTYCALMAMRTLKFPYKDLRIGIFFQSAAYLGKSDREVCSLLGVSMARLKFSKCLYQIRKWIKG